MNQGYVFFSTDGLRDYVEMPDGVKYILGTMSVIRLISPLAPSNEVRRVCDAFNEGKRPRLWVDLDLLWEALELNIRRSRWASDDSASPDLLIPVGNRTPQTESTTMSDSKTPDFSVATKRASIATFEQNTSIVEETLKTVEATNEKIDNLVAAGKKFNHVAAKRDLMKVASRVTEITASVDLGYDWIKADLETLAKTASEIHDLFPKDA
jgi:hypothetical protein